MVSTHTGMGSGIGEFLSAILSAMGGMGKGASQLCKCGGPRPPHLQSWDFNLQKWDAPDGK